jgi:hypothetical protein
MDTVTRTFPIELTNSYISGSIIELCHFRDMSFDTDERVAIYLESFFCNLRLKSFTLAVIPNFDGSESEIEKLSKFNNAEAKSQKIGLRILTRKNNIGNWLEKAEIILVNRGRKDYFDLLQPYLAKNQVRILETDDAIAIQLIDYGNGLLTSIDALGLEAAFTITIGKKNSLEAFEGRVSSLELAILGRLDEIPANTLLGRNVGTGVIETINQSKFATPAMLEPIIDQLNSKAPLADPNFNGFTTLGDNVAIKCKVIEGFTASTQGGFVIIPHGVISSKILSIIIMCNWLNQAWVPPNYTFNGGRQFTWDIPNEENISVINLPNNSASILSRPIRVFIIYKS